MHQPAEQDAPNITSHVSDFRHLLCTPCRSIVPYQMLYSHLHNYHKIRSSLCKVIVSQHEGLPSQTDADVVPLPAGSPPLEYLAPPERGYFCPQCDYTTSSWVNTSGLLTSLTTMPMKEAHTICCFLGRSRSMGQKRAQSACLIWIREADAHYVVKRDRSWNSTGVEHTSS